jgi:hypothetical protein
VKWLPIVVALLFIPGALWLASLLISYPQESVAFVKRYGVFGLLAIVTAWAIQSLARKKTNRKLKQRA